ncbi:MAG: hypothetical protein E2O39_14605 [Planctomycetota bacterium]|nr:MAG: hypothetical protein E2O39_14605 [Planctomycetota bacterium]
MKPIHALAVSLLLLACAPRSSVDASPETMPFEAELLTAAREFKTWDRVSDRANWSPLDCLAPVPAGVLSSESKDTGTHGRKLYFLYAKDGELYDELSLWSSPSDDPDGFADLSQRMVGQVLVKESFTSVEVDPDTVPRRQAAAIGARQLPDDYLLDGERAYRAGDPGALFVMLKLEPSTPGTDAGWVYGTLTADGTRVTASGRIESCMDCHVDEGRDRMYGHRRPRQLAR